MKQAPPGIILISPHQFLDLAYEQALAQEMQLALVVAKNQEEFSALMPQAQVIMVTPYGKVNAQDIARLRHCIAIVRYGIGYDNIDIRAAKAANIPVSIVPDASSEEVASHALAMGLALARRIPHGHTAIMAGQWAGQIGYDTPRQTQLKVGILGMGRIGRIVAKWWKAVGADVTAYDPFVDFHEVAQAPMAQIIKTADVLSLHLPLTEDTHHLIDAPAIQTMKSSCVLVNVSRGGLIDETALAQALSTGQIAGAALDVFAQEPLPDSSPLRDTPNVILTPHIAWRSNTSLDSLQDSAVARARLALLGQVLPDRVA